LEKKMFNLDEFRASITRSAAAAGVTLKRVILDEKPGCLLLVNETEVSETQIQVFADNLRFVDVLKTQNHLRIEHADEQGTHLRWEL
jgi:hypothetical protein